MIYLDNAATTKVCQDSIEKMLTVLREDFGNPSSMHRLGVKSEKLINEARNRISQVIRSNDKDIVFTSGGTESNNLAIIGSLSANPRLGKHIITSRLEHKSVLETYKKMESLGYEVSFVDNDQNGVIDSDHLRSLVKEDTALVSIMHVNNEIGKINDIEKLVDTVKERNKHTIFHVDAVQSFCKLNLDVKSIKADLISFSGHKVFAPKGVGALYIRPGTRIDPILFGGSQENCLRAGTENIAGIVAFGEAVRCFSSDIRENLIDADVKMSKLISGITEEIDYSVVVGDGRNLFSPYIAAISFKGIRSEVLLHALESKGVYISTGSACNSKNKEYSHVLNGLGLRDGVKEGTIRISISSLTTMDEINDAIIYINDTVKELAKIMRRGKR